MEEDHVKTEVETRAWLYKLNSAKDLGVPETKKARKNPYLRPSVAAGSCQGLKRSPKNTFLFRGDLQCDSRRTSQPHKGATTTLPGFVVSHFSVERNFIAAEISSKHKHPQFTLWFSIPTFFYVNTFVLLFVLTCKMFSYHCF